jgi:hypothetical protein
MVNKIILEGFDFDGETIVYDEHEFKVDMVNARCDCEIASITLAVAVGVSSNATYDVIRGVFSLLVPKIKLLCKEKYTKVKVKRGKMVKEISFNWEATAEQKDKLVDALIEELKSDDLILTSSSSN